MNPASDPQEDVALAYIRLVRLEYPDSAAIIEQIHIRFGSPAALRAALTITLLSEEIQHYHSMPDIRMYTSLLKDYRDAIPLLERAITVCLEGCGIPESDKSGWEKWLQTLESENHVLRNPFEDLLQRFRQHSPITAKKLEQIYEHFGVTAGGYGAAAIIWLEARMEMFGYRVLVELSEQEIQEFTFFQYMRNKEGALGQFVDMLECYRIEQRPARVHFQQVTPVGAN